MKLLNFIIIKLTCCLTIGILIAAYFKIPVTVSFCISIALAIVLATLHLIEYKTGRKTIWFGILVALTTTSLGVLIYNTHIQINFKNHYTKHISAKHEAPIPIVFKIKERLKPSVYYDKYLITILSVNKKQVVGKSLLNIKKDSTRAAYHVDDLLMITSNFERIKPPVNPNQFDYKNYLRKQYVYHQLFTDKYDILNLKSKQSSIFGYADTIRTHINKTLSHYDFKPEELAIINALLLGQRQDMSKAIYNDYTNAGAVHILAVSGLHIGIILLLLHIGLRPVEQLKHGKKIKIILILLMLWSFAIIAGLSASVTRAVTMFSIVAIAMHLKRPTNIFNTLAISIFFLLAVKPMFLFEIGFQLSYAAVIAIVTIQPLLYSLWQPKWKGIDYFWKLFTVTIAAQFGVVPLSLYYFHQFPSLFFISNLAIIPCLGVILGLGILILVLAVLHILPQYLADLFGYSISTMNALVAWVSRQESFVFKNIAFNEVQVFSCYLLMMTVLVWYRKPNYRRLVYAGLSVLCLQISWTYTTYKNSKQQFVIFHKSRKTLIAEQTNSLLHISHNIDSITWTRDKIISNFKVGNFITSSTTDSLKSVYSFKQKTIMIIDSLGIYKVKSFTPDYVLMCNSPKINLDRMIDSLHPKHIIADGSNYTSYVNRWKKTCLKRKLPFHHTGTKGAYTIK